MLASCGQKRAIVRTETVTVYVPTYKALDPALTAVAPEPAPPPALCRFDGQNVPCLEGVYDELEQLRAWGRGMAGKLHEIRGLQPQ